MKNKEKNEKKKKELTSKRATRILLISLTVVVLLIGCGFAGVKLFYKFGLDTYFTAYSYKSVKYTFAEDVCGAAESISETAETEIKALPKVYVIPRDQYVAPKPNKKNYDKEYTSYSDETITVNYYRQRIYKSTYHFMEVKIAHPSQFRMALCDNEFGAAKKYPQHIAMDVNAVAAIDGCYYNHRGVGVIINQGKIYRMKPGGLDVLLIDSEGDLHIVNDTKVESSGILEKYDIVNSVTFGPALVLNGERQIIRTGHWEARTNEPRAAIGQLGKLHYLLCVVEGRLKNSEGITQQKLANVMAEKGCITAYNLDGGQSATLILGNKVKNTMAYGGQRILGDILYFATAIDEEDK